MTIDLLIVGPSSQKAGGVSRYVTEQHRQLPDYIQADIYDIAESTDGSLSGFFTAFLRSIADFITFPFQSRPETLHIHTSHRFSFYRAAFYVLFGSYIWRRPVVLHIHGSSFDKFVQTDSRPLRAFQSVVFDACESIIVLSDYWRGVLADRVDESKLRVHPNAVDVEEYDPTFEVPEPRITFISNHVQRKGIIELVTAIDRLKQEDVGGFRVSIAGDGPEADRSRELAAQYDRIEYLGYITEAEKRNLLDESSIYVLPTHAEGLPIAILEAMAGGNTIVSTEVGSIPEVIDESGGRLVEPGEVNQLVDVLRSLIHDPQSVEAMGRHNRDLVVEQYSWAAVSRELAGIYRSTVGTGEREEFVKEPR